MSPSAITVPAGARIGGQLAFSTRPLDLAGLLVEPDDAEMASPAS